MAKYNEELKGGSMDEKTEATCYALLLFTYDYFEWEETYAVSFDPQLLRAYYEGLDCLYADKPLVDSSEHSAYADYDEVHWTIEPITFLRSN